MMSALPFFPQSSARTAAGLAQTPAANQNSAAGELLNFEAILSQNGRSESLQLPKESARPNVPQGSFEDVSVILQMLRASAPIMEMEAALPLGREANDLAEQPDITLQVSERPDLPSPLLLQNSASLVSKISGGTEDAEPMMPDHLSPLDQPSPFLPLQSYEAMRAQIENHMAPAALPIGQAEVESDSDAPQHGASETSEAPETPQTLPPIAAIPAPMPQGSNQAPAAIAPAMAASAAIPPPSMAKPPITPSSAPKSSGTSAAPLMAEIDNPAALAMPIQRAPQAASASLASAIPLPQASASSAEPLAAFLQPLHQAAASSQPLSSIPTTPAAPVSEQILDLMGDDGWIDQLAKDIATAKSTSGEISFRLMPRHLGRLDIAMSQNDQGISVRMEAQQEAAVAIVAAAQGRLVDELRQQGVRITSAEIAHQSDENNRDLQQHDSQGQPKGGAQFIETAPDRQSGPEHDPKNSTADRGRFA